MMPIDDSALLVECTWDSEILCYMLGLLKDDGQYITWLLVFFGWIVSVLIAFFQGRQNSKVTKDSNHNEWVRELREKLVLLEDDALSFWTTDTHSLSNSIILERLGRSVKELTTISRDIEKVGGVKYPPERFKALRQSITNDNDLDSRPIPDSHFRVIAIRSACNDLRRYFHRKS